ncbi:MAG: riboflavin synthase [Lachnospiraceae bacterium]|nr:riboflavin synthase [Lachnospiraceae bacterium]
MFTGIVEETGTIRALTLSGMSGQIEIAAKTVLEGTKIGDSIAVNGICLTVVSKTKDSFRADVMAETVRRSSLSSLGEGDPVNLERAMASDGRFGGHIVSGHIDGTGTITSLVREENAVWVTIRTEEALLRYIVEKGSIAIDGISLTVAAVDSSSFKVSVIPHTSEETTLLRKKAGDLVNLETDIVGKYVGRLLGFATKEDASFGEKSTGLTMEFLAEHGF